MSNTGKSKTDYIDLGCDDCPDENLPVKKKLFQGNGARCNSFGYTCDPVLDEMKDFSQDGIMLAYTQYPIIPFFDKGDATLKLFRKLKDYSPTHGGCIQSIGDYVLGGEFTVTSKKRAGFVRRGEKKVEDSEFNGFIDFVESLHPNIDGEYLLSVAAGIYENYKTYGNAFLRVDLFEIGGERFVYLQNIDAEMCRYHLNSNGQLEKTILISPLWTLDYVNENPPEFINVYPHFTNFEEENRSSTIIHIKNKVAGRDWYGQPDAMASLYYQYLEFQGGQYNTEGYASDFTAKAFIEITGDEEGEDDWNDFNRMMEEAFTNKGQKKKLMLRRKSAADDDATVHEFDSNTNHEYHIGMSSLSEGQIIKTHNWHKTLMGIPQPGRLGSEKDFDGIYRNKYKNVIRPYQKKVMSPINMGLTIGAAFMGNSITDTYSLDLANLYEDALMPKTDENPPPFMNEDEVMELVIQNISKKFLR